MKKRLPALLLALVLVFSLLPGTVFAASAVPTQEEAYQAMIAMKSQYPEGMPWTNANSYVWRAVPNTIITGYGCAGFAFLLSDAAFGDLPARKVTGFAFSDVRAGDILRVNDNTHSVIVLTVNSNGVTVAEGNYGVWNGAGFDYGIHWGRTMTKAEVLAADYMYTRYPVETGPAEPTQPTQPAEPTQPDEPKPELPTKFKDVPAGEYYTDAVVWAVGNGIANGTGGKKFSPANTCSEVQILTFLWRAENEPVAEPSSLTVDATYQKAVDRAYAEGMIDDDFDPNASCTRAKAVYFIWMVRGEEIATAKSFKDVDAEAYYAGAVSWAVASGIANGIGGKQFSPDTPCARGMIVTFLHRAYVHDARV